MRNGTTRPKTTIIYDPAFFVYVCNDAETKPTRTPKPNHVNLITSANYSTQGSPIPTASTSPKSRFSPHQAPNSAITFLYFQLLRPMRLQYLDATIRTARTLPPCHRIHASNFVLPRHNPSGHGRTSVNRKPLRPFCRPVLFV